MRGHDRVDAPPGAARSTSSSVSVRSSARNRSANARLDLARARAHRSGRRRTARRARAARRPRPRASPEPRRRAPCRRSTKARSTVDAGKRETGCDIRSVRALASSASTSISHATTGAASDSASTTALATSPIDADLLAVDDDRAAARSGWKPGDGRGRRARRRRRGAPAPARSAPRWRRTRRRRGRARAAPAARDGPGRRRASGARRATSHRGPGGANTVPLSNSATSGEPCAALYATERSRPGSSAGRRIDSSARSGFSTSMSASGASPTLARSAGASNGSVYTSS